jgi:EAL domain-containing protein (putative c-di-GMP-specific phosphodiesterase class I)
MEADLRLALERSEFEVYYQPIVSLPDGAITSLEALVRWHHPERGFLFPAEFIPAAEESGLIEPINNWVIHTACRQLKEWLSVAPGLLMSVNLTVRQLQDPTLPIQLKEILAENELDGRSLQLEVSENLVLEDQNLTISILNNLQNMGLQIALDDFGMRSSSLNYLRRFPVNTIKIDKSFIWDIFAEEKNATFARTIIQMGHQNHKNVVAEGVETHRQLDFLHTHECDSVQGYLYSEAQDSNAITMLLKHGPTLTPNQSDTDVNAVEEH